MEGRITINLLRAGDREIKLNGTTEASALLGSEATGSLRSAGSVSYNVRAQVYDGKELVAQAELKIPLRVRCERCLREFDYTLPVTCTVNVSLEGDEEEVDLTDDLREEIILALPAYPKCELIGDFCQINDVIGEFGLDKASQPGVNSVAPGGQSVWDALDAVSTSPAE